MKIKKNDKAYLQDLKIDIRASKDINYQELALLFDKPAFLNMLPKLRETYSVPNLISLEEYREYFTDGDPGSSWANEAKADLSKYSKLNDLKKNFSALLDSINTTEFPVVLEDECYLLCYEFNRPPHFYRAIRQAIFCETVTDDDFRPTEAVIIEANSLWFDTCLPPVAIFVSPTTTYDDIKEEFRKAKEMMKTDKRLSYYQPRTDLTPNIRKYRHWYWERIKGKTHQQIADEWLEKHETENTTYLDVLKAVKTYEKLLAS